MENTDLCFGTVEKLYTVWCKFLMGENFDEWASGKF